MNDKQKYCDDCGCEILSKDDIGYEYKKTEYWRDYPMLKSSPMIKIVKPFIICINCYEEAERHWEEFKKTDAFKYECQFQKWVEKNFK